MTHHSERAIRTRMRERGVKPNVANLERVMADIRAGERQGRVPSNMGAPSAQEVAARRAAAVRDAVRRPGGGRPV